MYYPKSDQERQEGQVSPASAHNNLSLTGPLCPEQLWTVRMVLAQSSHAGRVVLGGSGFVQALLLHFLCFQSFVFVFCFLKLECSETYFTKRSFTFSKPFYWICLSKGT